MDYFKCDKCGKVFDEFETNFNKSAIHGKTLCIECWNKEDV